MCGMAVLSPSPPCGGGQWGGPEGQATAGEGPPPGQQPGVPSKALQTKLPRQAAQGPPGSRLRLSTCWALGASSCPPRLFPPP